MTDRDLWLMIRRALLMIVKAIEKRWLVSEKFDTKLDDHGGRIADSVSGLS